MLVDNRKRQVEYSVVVPSPILSPKSDTTRPKGQVPCKSPHSKHSNGLNSPRSPTAAQLEEAAFFQSLKIQKPEGALNNAVS